MYLVAADLSIPAGLRRMGTPVHVLLTKEGLILQTWTGTSMDPEVRMRMAKQISSDLLLIDHIVKIFKSAEIKPAMIEKFKSASYESWESPCDNQPRAVSIL